jgi:hypothetical protein
VACISPRARLRDVARLVIRSGLVWTTVVPPALNGRTPSNLREVALNSAIRVRECVSYPKGRRLRERLQGLTYHGRGALGAIPGTETS